MAFPKTSILLFTLIIFCSVTSSPASQVGGWEPIKNVDDPEIQALAKFALTQHNKLRGVSLQFGRILQGVQQVVSGMNYKLILAATSGGKPGKYEAVVWVQPWQNVKKLTSFRSV
uniref:Cystatin domain-containing protein n=1 Tax=Kalanchoe fedtschenkoi TaxID=63787 RepID=A0A7N0USI5_KALFE